MAGLKPADLLHFVELRAFTEAWDRALGLGDDDLTALQVLVMLRPKDAPVIAGTGGLRKLRFAPSDWPQGKRGAVRVCYVHYEALGVVVLVTAYAKGRKEDLTAEEKKAIARLIREVEAYLQRRPRLE